MRLKVRRPTAKAGAFVGWPLRLLETLMYLRTARIVLAVVLTIALCDVGTRLSAAAEAANPVTTTAPTQIPGRDAILLGAAWYPEQWPEARGGEDLRLMEAAHLSVVRVAEFAWSTLEPAEGKFELDWLERAVALAAKHHVMVVLGTPTA